MTKSIGGSGESTSEIFNPETLLSLIIDKIKDYNSLAQTNEASPKGNSEQINGGGAPGTEAKKGPDEEDYESIYIGLLQLTGKIIDNFDISMSEKLVESKNLIDEIFVNFLFSSIFQH